MVRFEWFHLNNILILVSRPVDSRLISCKWIFKCKNGNLEIGQQKIKVRLVDKGFTKSERVDYNDVFSFAVKYISI